MRYATPAGGMPGQADALTGRSIFTNSYAMIPRGVMRDIVTSRLPGWQGTRAWMLARPMSGFAETFAQLAVEVAPDGGSNAPEPDPRAESVLFVLDGTAEITVNGVDQPLRPGSYAYLSPGCVWSFRNQSATTVTFMWVRKRYELADGFGVPEAFVTHEADQTPAPMPNAEGLWHTTRFVDDADLRHDMQVNIVTFQPGGRIPFEETHVMEHGIYILQGQADYLLNTDWVVVEPGDFLWLRAFCPQACVAKGEGAFKYLIYRDINRHMPLAPPR